jgi:hypothetical protein
MKLFAGVLIATSLVILATGPAASAGPAISVGEMLLPAGTTQSQCTAGGASALAAAGFTATSGPIGAHGHNDSFTVFVLCDTAYSRQVFVVVGGDHLGGSGGTTAVKDRLKANLASAIPGTINAP